MIDYIFTNRTYWNYDKEFKKGRLYSLVLNLQSQCDQFIDRWDQHIDNLISLVDNDVSKFTQVKSSLMVTKTVKKSYQNGLLHWKRAVIAKKFTAEESVWRMLAYHNLLTTIYCLVHFGWYRCSLQLKW